MKWNFCQFDELTHLTNSLAKALTHLGVAIIKLPKSTMLHLQFLFSVEEGLGLPLVVKKVAKKVILLKSTEESTQKCTQKSAQVKKD